MKLGLVGWVLLFLPLWTAAAYGQSPPEAKSPARTGGLAGFHAGPWLGEQVRKEQQYEASKGAADDLKAGSRENSTGGFQAGRHGNILILIHRNPENKILHTALVGEMNGCLMAMTQGTSYEREWGHFGGPSAYNAWIQPAVSTARTAGGDTAPVGPPAGPPAPGTASAMPPAVLDAPALTPDRDFPARLKDAPGGAAVMLSVAALPLAERESVIESQITGGNLPAFLRTFKPIRIHGKDRNSVEHSVVYEVLPDYLAVGSDVDFVRVPLTPMTALHIADRFGCTLPTRKMVKDIYLQAELKLEPHPLTENRETVQTFVEHNTIIETRRRGKPLGLLLAGIKKDVVSSKRLLEKPDRVAIYGWHKLDGTPIQPLTTVHRSTYVDYSHGIRLVHGLLLVDGKPMTVASVLKDPILDVLLTDE